MREGEKVKHHSERSLRQQFKYPIKLAYLNAVIYSGFIYMYKTANTIITSNPDYKLFAIGASDFIAPIRV